jgi:flavodoxin
MYSVLILWAPDSTENRRIVDAISHVFDELKTTTVVKPAAEATIADVNASEIVLFGVEKSGSAELPPEYSEWVRVFKGITLAGRTAGFFSMGGERATARLRKALKDTEIAQRDDDPLFVDSRQVDMSEWARKLVTGHREMKNGRS